MICFEHDRYQRSMISVCECIWSWADDMVNQQQCNTFCKHTSCSTTQVLRFGNQMWHHSHDLIITVCNCIHISNDCAERSRLEWCVISLKPHSFGNVTKDSNTLTAHVGLKIIHDLDSGVCCNCSILLKLYLCCRLLVDQHSLRRLWECSRIWIHRAENSSRMTR